MRSVKTAIEATGLVEKALSSPWHEEGEEGETVEEEETLESEERQTIWDVTLTGAQC